ncbi:MAG: DinB family protein [candidate division Zixibacteria bacterium]|nr:DinB family protein [candidate division Zixibacteria bacterium]
MSKSISPLISPAPGFKSEVAGLYFTQLEDQTRRLLKAIADITPAELEWQPQGGMNSIGMLLAHVAGAEVAWAMRGLEGYQATNIDEFIAKLEALGFPDDGAPLPADGKPPAYFSGKDLAYFTDSLSRAREYWRNASARLTDADVDRETNETIWDGTQRTYTPRWVMYHVLVHFPGHASQIYLLRHMYRDAMERRSK